jgi:hypothetical protein
MDETTTMLNKKGQEMYSEGEEEFNQSERPPAFNPDFVPSASNSDENMNYQHQHHSPDRPPPYYNPNLDENVVWDENLSPERDNSYRGEREEGDPDIPTTPRDDAGQYSPSSPTANTSPSSLAYWSTKTKHMAQGTWNKMKRFEEKHDLSNKTKKGAKSVYKQTKRATLTASRKIKEFDDKHQVVAKSKNGIVQGSTYISSKCRPRHTM